MSTPRYFHAENCNRNIRLEKGAFRFAFDPYTYCGGSWSGIYRTSSPGEIAELEQLVQQPRSAVTEIGEAEFVVCMKKKQTTQRNSGISLPQPVEATQSPFMPEEPVAVPVVGATINSELALPEPDVKPLGSAAEALDVGPVAAAVKECDLT
jgi:hypothetical protein